MDNGGDRSKRIDGLRFRETVASRAVCIEIPERKDPTPVLLFFSFPTTCRIQTHTTITRFFGFVLEQVGDGITGPFLGSRRDRWMTAHAHTPVNNLGGQREE